MAGYGYAALATMVGLSLSAAAPDVMAGTPVTATATATGGQATAVVDATIGGVAVGRPRLRFAVETQGGFPVTAVTVILPRGLFFSKKATDLEHGVRIGTDTPRSHVRKGRLTVTLARPSTRFKLTVAGAAMTEGQKLETAISKLVLFNEAHMRHQRALPLKLTLVMASGRHATLEVANTIPFR